MKKKITLLFSITVFVGNCIIINTAGVGENRVKGEEVKDRIQMAAILSDILFIEYFGKPLYYNDTIYISFTSILGPVFMKIKEDEYYYESDVKECTNYMNNILGIFLRGDYASVIMKPCLDLRPVDGDILGKPFPKL